jgi:DNA/RNA endonuclease G (NUC1)
MNYQGVMWQEIFLERHYTNPTPRPRRSTKAGAGDSKPAFSPPRCTPTEESFRVSPEFWKVVVIEDSERNKKHAIAHLLSQGQLIHKLPEDRNHSGAVEGFVLEPYHTFHISVADLEAATAHGFDALKDADPVEENRSGP